MQSWARRIVDTWPPGKNDVRVYFNNDLGGAAVVDAAKFAGGSRVGRTVSRTPPAPPARSAS
ncbi:hypothetical protein [Streptomyces sp. NBC_01361]|uniref:hypothetical protein n=1 Tax=Streptomyces sp. NBC_01361 TaxID=2903838 RepID=UPI002E3342A8|nr:hypothetical protein [Streptomyces sp. NBC_01361]